MRRQRVLSVFQSLRSTGPVNAVRNSKWLCIMYIVLYFHVQFLLLCMEVCLLEWLTLFPHVSLVLLKHVTPRSRVSTLQQMEWMTWTGKVVADGLTPSRAAKHVASCLQPSNAQTSVSFIGLLKIGLFSVWKDLYEKENICKIFAYWVWFQPVQRALQTLHILSHCKASFFILLIEEIMV